MSFRPRGFATPRLLRAAVLGGSVLSGCDDGGRSEEREELRQAPQPLAECREGSFAVGVGTATLVDVQAFDPPLHATIPATLAGIASQPAWTAELRFIPSDPLQATTCTYACTAAAGACADDRLAALGCTGPLDLDPGDVVDAATVTMQLVPAGIPDPLVTSGATWDFQEAGPCPTGCEAAAIPLGDGDPCTLDFCRDVGGEATAVHIDACAAPIDRTVTTKMADMLAVVIDEEIQVDVAEGAIDVVIAAGVGGRVLLPSGDPAPGVAVSVVGHPELGRTETDANGEYRMLVNGGGELTLAFDRPGHVDAQRLVRTSWQSWVRTEDVVLTEVSSTSTFVRLDEVDGLAAVVGDGSTDAAGTRTPRILIPEGTTAALELADGSTVPTSTATVRITELTVGEEGLLAMPTLPPETAYTHAFSVDLDETREVGAVGVVFDSPVFYYVENFIGVAPGSAVPVGRYDGARGTWIGQPDGAVVAILSTAGGVADLDFDGDGLPESTATLDAFRVTDAEREYLAATYTAGEELWRVPLTHLSTIDCNLPPWPDEDCEPGACDDESDCADAECDEDPDQVDDGEDDEDDEEDEPTCREGSIIGCENQSLGERIAIAGTDLGLNYRSDRNPGRWATIRVPLTESVVPANLRRARAIAFVAGRRYEQTIECEQGGCVPEQFATFTWDGTDAFGRPVTGRQIAQVLWEYDYPVIYGQRPAEFDGRSWGRPGTSAGPRAIFGEGTRTAYSQRVVGSFDVRGLGLGGWTLDDVHVFDPLARTVLYGDGTTRRLERKEPVIRNWRLSPGGSSGAIATPRGTMLLKEGARVLAEWDSRSNRKVRSLPALLSGDISNFDVGSDGTVIAAVRLSGELGVRLYRLEEPAGVWTHIAGNGDNGDAGDGGPATEAAVRRSDSSDLSYALRLAVRSDGTVYLRGLNRIRRIGPDGTIDTILGNGAVVTNATRGDGGFAIAARTGTIHSLEVGADGSLYFAESSSTGSFVRRIRPDGIVERVAGSETAIASPVAIGDPLQVKLPSVIAMALDRSGALYLGLDDPFANHAADWNGYRGDVIRKVFRGRFWPITAADGPVTPLSVSASCTTPTGCRASGKSFTAGGGHDRMSTFPDGRVTFSSTSGGRHFIESDLPVLGNGDFGITRKNGTLQDVFDADGRHLRTIDTRTAATIKTIEYDAAGQLAAVVDHLHGKRTVIQRDADGVATGVVGPFGHVTDLVVNEEGWLGSVIDPNGLAHVMGYEDGLMTSFKRPGNTEPSVLVFDANGRLTSDRDPLGNAISLSRADRADGYSVAVHSPTGLVTIHDVARTTHSKDRTTEAPGGLLSATSDRQGRARVTTRPDGTTVEVRLLADPRLGPTAMYPAVEITTLPGGPTRTIVRKRTSSGTDLSTYSSATEEVWLNPASIESPTEPHQTTVFSRSSRLETSTTPEGRQLVRRLDLLGRPTSVKRPGVLETTFAYDAATGRLAQWAQGTRSGSTTYGADGMPETITDALGHVSTLAWDPAGRLSTVTRTDLQVATFAHDDNGHPAAISVFGGATHSFTHDAVDRLASYAPPTVSGSGATLFAHDADRRPDAETRPGGVVVDHQYDASTGWLTAMVGPSSAGLAEQVVLSYDAPGRVSSLAGPRWTSGSPEQMLAVTYQGPYVVAEESTGAVDGVVAWTLDDRFRKAAETIDGSHEVLLSYDADDLLTGSGELTIGRSATTGWIETIASTHAGHTVTETRTYDTSHGELATLTTTWDATPLLEVAYSRDDLGRITSKTETLDGVTSVTAYTYDTAGRLTDVEVDGVTTEHYEFDANGNRTSATNSAGTVAATFDAQDRIEAQGGDVFAHTPNGELSSRTGSSPPLDLTYDVFGNLRVATIGGLEVAYVADARGRRVSRLVDGATTASWLWHSALAPAAQLDATGVVEQRYHHADRVNAPELVVDVATGERWRLVKDHLGSVRLVVDVGTGDILRRLDFDSYGRVVSSATASGVSLGVVPFGFAGGLWDPDTGLVRFGARDYDPETGRWTAKDPIRFDGGDTNLYAYVGNDPVNHADPTGLVVTTGPSGGGGHWVDDVLDAIGDSIRDTFGPESDDMIPSVVFGPGPPRPPGGFCPANDNDGSNRCYLVGEVPDIVGFATLKMCIYNCGGSTTPVPRPEPKGTMCKPYF